MFPIVEPQQLIDRPAVAMQKDDQWIRSLVIRLVWSEKMKSTDLPIVEEFPVGLKTDHLSVKRVFDA